MPPAVPGVARTIFQDLTEAQRAAVEHVDGPLLILAGPGSGKTRVITHRIAHLLHVGVAPSQVLALTFTNKAADELRARVAQLVPGSRVWTSTFHRFCARLLREYSPLVGLDRHFVIYDADDSRKQIRHALEAARHDTDPVSVERVAAAISWAKNNLVLPEEYQPRPSSLVGPMVAEVYPLYQERLRRSNAVDFDDLLLYVARLLRDQEELRRLCDERFRYVLVDEYQDTNLAQYAIVRALSIDYPNLAVTGDPDQAIYSWRGATIRNILDFEHDYPSVRVVRLEQNFRSTQRILSVADALISHNLQRKPKRLFTENAPGIPVRFTLYADEVQEAGRIAARIAHAVRSGQRSARDFAIFYRLNALSSTLERALREHALPYQIVNGVAFFQRKEVKDVVAYLALLNNPRDDLALLRVINTPPRGIGAATLRHLRTFADEHRLPLLEAARHSAQVPRISARSSRRIEAFVQWLDRLAPLVHGAVEPLLQRLLDESGYRQQFQDSDDQQDDERLANIEELVTVARRFDSEHPGGSLEEFLEQTALVNDTDTWEAQHDSVTLMTLHASKGLEFPVVFIIALEEGLLPHERSRRDPAQLEEERRLLFVGMTRAQQELHLSRAARRSFRGHTGSTIPSVFLGELPPAEVLWEDETAGPQPPTADLLAGPRLPEALRASAAELAQLLRTADQLLAPETSLDRGHAAIPSPPDAGTRQPGGGLAATAQAAAAADASPGNDLPGTDEVTVDDAAPAQLAFAGEPHCRALPNTSQADPCPPDVFVPGLAVKHPKYGLGKIVAVSGTGQRRQATVQFVAETRQRKIILAYSPLRPAHDRVPEPS
jgi:DNA helicase-2/ATP-dependent DNA helicase PcrA